ncbi:MAG: cationic peptide transport system ATP-binding protein [Phenylobacterium sp.]|jgi:cationic peptide transport system ATP-binding protein
MLLLDIKNMTIKLTGVGNTIRAVDRVNLSIKEGEVHGLVGESGSGKSLIAKAIVSILHQRWEVTADRLQWCGQDLLQLSDKKRRQILSRDIAMIYQEPSRCLDPTATMTVQLEESIPGDQLTGNFWQRRKQRKAMSIALLHKVGIKNHERCLNSYPHQLSEGDCQKIMIAMAIAKKPKLLIADEPTTSLESTTRAQVFRVLKKLNQLNNMSIMLISHDLSTLTDWTHSVSVLYCGQMVESGATEQVFKKPYHPYTQALINAVPDFNHDLAHKSRLFALEGSIPTLQHLPIGCRLGPRCPNAQKECVKKPKSTRDHHHSFSCHHPIDYVLRTIR